MLCSCVRPWRKDQSWDWIWGISSRYARPDLIESNFRKIIWIRLWQEKNDLLSSACRSFSVSLRQSQTLFHTMQSHFHRGPASQISSQEAIFFRQGFCLKRNVYEWYISLGWLPNTYSFKLKIQILKHPKGSFVMSLIWQKSWNSLHFTQMA